MDGWVDGGAIDWFWNRGYHYFLSASKRPECVLTFAEPYKRSSLKKRKKQVFSPFLPFSGSLVRNKRGDKINDGEFESVSARWSLSVNCSSPWVGNCHLLAIQCASQYVVMCSVLISLKVCIVLKPCTSCVSMKIRRINKCAENYNLSFSLSDANRFKLL